MRLIDADALKRDICKYCNDVYSDDPCEPSDCEHMRIIDSQPTIDAVEVARCKDCKYHVCDDDIDYRCLRLTRCTKFDDYFSYGERKNDETD